MSIWKEIRKALNSTIGTDDFKSLDKIIRDSYYVYASDDLLKTMYDITYSEQTDDVPLTNIGTINISGVIRIKIEAHHGGKLDFAPAIVFVGKNGVVEGVTFPSSSGGSVGIDLEVNEGDVIQFKVAGNIATGYYVKELKITANGKIGSAPDTGIFIE